MNCLDIKIFQNLTIFKYFRGAGESFKDFKN